MLQIQNLRFKMGQRKGRAAAMRINQNEIIEDILEHIRQSGGESSDWCVGTAKDSHAPFFLRPADQAWDDGLIYRQAYTTYAAAEVVERLQASGLRPDRDSFAGDIVFVYRPARANPAPTPSAGLPASMKDPPGSLNSPATSSDAG